MIAHVAGKATWAWGCMGCSFLLQLLAAVALLWCRLCDGGGGAGIGGRGVGIGGQGQVHLRGAQSDMSWALMWVVHCSTT